MTANGGVQAWTDANGDGIVVAVLNTGGGIASWTDSNSDGIPETTQSAGGGISVPIAESDVTNLVTDLAAKAPLASPTFTGTPSLPTGTTASTQSAADSTTKLATTAFVTTADNLKANLASPTFTGTVTVPNGSSATNAAAFGQIPTAGGVGGFSKVVVRTGDSSTISSNNVLANDDTLLWAVGASDRWFFQAILTFTAADSGGAAATADVQMGWSVPTGGTMQWGAFGQQGNGLAGYNATATSSSPLAILTAAGASAQGGAAVSFGVTLAGFYTGDGSHTGNVNLQWAQNTSNAATLLIAKNSTLILWRLA